MARFRTTIDCSGEVSAAAAQCVGVQSRRMSGPVRHKGFTLMELMITVAIIGILVAIAYPSYQAQLMKGRRAAAQSYMMDLAQSQQRYLLDRRLYAASEADLNATTPTDVTPYYTIAIAAPAGNPPSFTITATAIGSQVPDGNLTLNNLGAKTPTGKW